MANEKKGETWKAKQRRLAAGFFVKYAPSDKPGIDLGASKDPLYPGRFTQWRTYDRRFGDGDATFMADVEDETYHTVYASHLLEHLAEPDVGLKNWWRILQPGGHLIVIVPHRDLYERKQKLPSRWAPEHKTFWLPESSDPPDTINFKEFLTTHIPNGEIVEFVVHKAGWKDSPLTEHAVGEFSIEAIIKKH